MKLQNVKPTKYDDLNTESEAIKFLLDNIPLTNINTIWECAGESDSKISKYLVDKGYNVILTDIKNGVNFLELEFDCDMIITNPPYSKKDKF